MEQLNGTLYSVATPIGNSRDMSERGREILETVDIIAAEDTRRSVVLLNKLGMKREDLLAFGDGYNDIPMLQFAGTGVAMGNAAEEIKKAADEVAPSNNDDGIAIFLENEMKG